MIDKAYRYIVSTLFFEPIVGIYETDQLFKSYVVYPHGQFKYGSLDVKRVDDKVPKEGFDT